jgi:hypothetical protein
MDGLSVVGAIGEHRGERTVGLGEQGADPGGVAVVRLPRRRRAASYAAQFSIL